MAIIRQYHVEWHGLTWTGVSTFYAAQDGGSVTDQRVALNSFCQDLMDISPSTTNYEVTQAGNNLDDATGQVVQSWTDPAARSGFGLLTEEPVPDASQGLIQWRTSEYRGGREVRGRTFIPGLGVSVLEGGELSAAAIGQINVAAANLVTPSVGFGVWKRPVGGAGGELVPLSAGTAWTELAVLRGRRS